MAELKLKPSGLFFCLLHDLLAPTLRTPRLHTDASSRSRPGMPGTRSRCRFVVRRRRSALASLNLSVRGSVNVALSLHIMSDSHFYHNLRRSPVAAPLFPAHLSREFESSIVQRQSLLPAAVRRRASLNLSVLRFS